jgi:hypothetical protein
MTVTARAPHTCTCYLDGYFDAHNDTNGWTGHDPDCPCKWTIETAIVSRT